MSREDHFGRFPDYLANECNDQEPVLSNIGRGPKGVGLNIWEGDVENDYNAGLFRFRVREDEFGRILFQTPNLSAGVWKIEQTDPDWAQFALIRDGVTVYHKEVRLPRGPSGARFTVATETVDWPLEGIRPEDYDYTSAGADAVLHYHFSANQLQYDGNPKNTRGDFSPTQYKPPQIGDLVLMTYQDHSNPEYPRFGWMVGYVHGITWDDDYVSADDIDPLEDGYANNTDSQYYQNRTVADKGIHVIGMKCMPFITDELLEIIDNKIQAALTSALRFVGYISPSEPADVWGKIGQYWYEHDTTQDTGNEGNIPDDTFPWTEIKVWDGEAWVDPKPYPDLGWKLFTYTDPDNPTAATATYYGYAPNALELWSDLSTDEGWYWFGNHWQRNDLYVDGYTIGVVDGKIEVIKVPAELVWYTVTVPDPNDPDKTIEVEKDAPTILDEINAELAKHQAHLVVHDGEIDTLEKWAHGQDKDGKGGVDKHLDDIDDHLDTVDTHLGDLDDEMDAVEGRADTLEKWAHGPGKDDTAGAEFRLDTLESDVDNAEGDIDTLEKWAHGPNKDDTAGAEFRLDTLETDVDAVEGRVNTIENRETIRCIYCQCPTEARYIEYLRQRNFSFAAFGMRSGNVIKYSNQADGMMTIPQSEITNFITRLYNSRNYQRDITCVLYWLSGSSMMGYISGFVAGQTATDVACSFPVPTSWTGLGTGIDITPASENNRILTAADAPALGTVKKVDGIEPNMTSSDPDYQNVKLTHFEFGSLADAEAALSNLPDYARIIVSETPSPSPSPVGDYVPLSSEGDDYVFDVNNVDGVFTLDRYIKDPSLATGHQTYRAVYKEDMVVEDFDYSGDDGESSTMSRRFKLRTGTSLDISWGQDRASKNFSLSSGIDPIGIYWDGMEDDLDTAKYFQGKADIYGFSHESETQEGDQRITSYIKADANATGMAYNERTKTSATSTGEETCELNVRDMRFMKEYLSNGENAADAYLCKFEVPDIETTSIRLMGRNIKERDGHPDITRRVILDMSTDGWSLLHSYDNDDSEDDYLSRIWGADGEITIDIFKNGTKQYRSEQQVGRLLCQIAEQLNAAPATGDLVLTRDPTDTNPLGHKLVWKAASGGGSNPYPAAPTANGNYVLKVAVSGGTPTYSWEEVV